jgi:chromosome segregation ATPase
MAGDEELERTVRRLAIDHAETRWLALRLDDDAKEIRQELRAMRTEQNARFDSIDRELDEHGRRFDAIGRELNGHGRRFDAIDRELQAHGEQFDSISGRLGDHGLELQEHGGRFDSVDAQLRMLTQLVGQVLERLPGEPHT